jgi:hypothetical protein
MEVVELRYSKSKVDRAGEVLKKVGLKTTDEGAMLALDVLSNWRAFHAYATRYFCKSIEGQS